VPQSFEEATPESARPRVVLDAYRIGRTIATIGILQIR